MEDARAMNQSISAKRLTAWHSALASFAVVLIIFIALYWMTAVSLIEIWANTGMFQYCFLIFPITAWLIWRMRHELVACYCPRACPWALVLLGGAVLLWFAGRIVNVDILQQVAFVVTVPSLFLLVFGTRVSRAVLFPLVYLVFAMPVGHSAVAPLQLVTAEISVHVLQWTGVPVLLQGGHYILTPSANWEVARACSGIKFFTACTAIGSLFAYLFFTSYWRRTVFIIASMIVPVIANGLRVYFTILIGETFGVQYAHGTDHMIFGWQFFGTVLFLLLLVGWFLREPPREDSRPESEHAEHNFAVRNMLATVVAAVLVLGGGAAWAGIIRASVSPATTSARVTLHSINGWVRQGGLAAGVWQPAYQGADFVVTGRYSHAGRQPVSLYVAAYVGAQVDGHDLLAYDNSIIENKPWRKVSAKPIAVKLTNGHQYTVNRTVARSMSGSRLVWYWYDVNGATYHNPVMVRSSQAWQQFRGASLHSAIIAVSTPVGGRNRRQARVTLRAFVAELQPPVKNAFEMFSKEQRK